MERAGAAAARPQQALCGVDASLRGLQCREESAMSTPTTLSSTKDAQANGPILISADSHVMEHPDFWVQGLPSQFKDEAPKFSAGRVGDVSGFQGRPGGHDSNARLDEMAMDGVSAE